MEWNGMEWNGMAWNGMEWNAKERNGMEWNGMDRNEMKWDGMEHIAIPAPRHLGVPQQFQRDLLKLQAGNGHLPKLKAGLVLCFANFQAQSFAWGHRHFSGRLKCRTFA